jgi:hypothetical protein
MSRTTLWLGACLLLCCWVLPIGAQQASSASSNVVVPPLVNFSGAVSDTNNKPLNGVVGLTFALYEDAQGGAPLWMETQNVQLDKTGHYSVMLGSTLSQGLPSNLFASGAARWLGVQAQGEPEQPRVLLVAVPYALKALDAETIGGKPASAFALATSAGTSVAANSAQPTATQHTSAAVSPSISGSGKPGYIAEWLGTTKLGDSALFQSSAGNLGISTVTPVQKLEIDLGNMLVRGADNFSKVGDKAYVYVGDTSHAIEAIRAGGLAIGAYKVPQAIFIQDKTGNVGIGTTTPTSGILNTVATSASEVGLSTTGYNAPASSNNNGSDGLHVTGGNGDPSGGNNGSSGGTAVVATGGIGTGSENGGGMGGVAVVAIGGTGSIPAEGIAATGGSGHPVGSSGGSFTAGYGDFGSGDGIDAACLGCHTNLFPSFAGNFDGDINVTGAVYAGAKDFKIDHPLDPANEYLLHASIESSEMVNLYSGNVVLESNGAATVQLPAWFEAVNGDFRYQLTAIGRSSPGLYVAQEISGNRFQIAGGAPGTKVSWQVVGVRHDAYAQAYPLVVEREKIALERGHYIHPELYGASEERSVEWARHPAWMKHVKEMRMKGLAAQGVRPANP